jgi:hypothetical protein
MTGSTRNTWATFATPYNQGIRWALPADQSVLEGLMTNFIAPDAYPVEGRGAGYSCAAEVLPAYVVEVGSS